MLDRVLAPDEVLGATRRARTVVDAPPFDTTADTTQGATRSDGEQPPANKSAYLNGFCNVGQRPETDDIGLWLRRSRVRAPSVTLPYTA